MSISPAGDKTLSRAVSDMLLAASSGSEEITRERTLEVVERITFTDAKIRGEFGSGNIEGKMRSYRDDLSAENFMGREVRSLQEGRFSKVIEISSQVGQFVAKIPTDGKGVGYIRQEIKILEDLNAKEKEKGRDHFIQLVGVITAKIDLFFANASVMLIPLCKGNLFDHIKVVPGGLCLEETLKITRQMLEALAFLKEEGIIHRDIKLTNILVSEDGTVKLADFGFAMRSIDRDERRGCLLGTAMYQSPELLQSARSFEIVPYSSASDIWAMGSTLFTTFSRQSLFQEVDPRLEGWVKGLELQQKDLESSTSYSLKARMTRVYLKKPLEASSELNRFEEVLTRMLNLNPLERLTPEEGLEILSSNISLAVDEMTIRRNDSF